LHGIYSLKYATMMFFRHCNLCRNQNVNLCYDLQEVLQLIYGALNIYDADKTGKVDFALESAGL